MAENHIPLRSEIPSKYKWNNLAVYSSDEAWNEDYKSIDVMIVPLNALKGKLSDGADRVVEAFKLKDQIQEKLEKLEVYAKVNHFIDKTDSIHLAIFDRIYSKFSEVASQTSWIRPELLSLPDDKIEEYRKFDGMQFWLRTYDEIIRYKPHTLSKEEEEILTLAGSALQTSADTYLLLTDADMKYGNVRDDDGNIVELSDGNYVKFLYSRNRDVRKGAWEATMQANFNLKNTLVSTFAGQIKADIFMQKARKFSSCLERSLFEDDIDVSVYNSLIDAVHTKLPAFHKYLAVRQRALGLDVLYSYDMAVPLVNNFDFKVTFEEARDIVLEALAPLGDEYVSIAKRGLTSIEEGGEAWADVFENQGKRTNCVSVQSYKLQPYMLLNFNGTLDSVFTLVHELGHSMHTYYSSHNQPHHTGIWRYITTEVPSTMNEALLHDYLLKKAQKEQNKKMELYLVNSRCEDYKGTIIRQTQFAEFERDVHTLAERGEALTPDSVSGLYKKISDEYNGICNTEEERKLKGYPHVLHDSPISAFSFARIPHFYYGFYVWRYALAMSVSDVLASQILAGKPADALDRFFGFIKAGDSKSPLDLITEAGVDVRTPKPFIDALERFEALTQDLERLIKEVDDLETNKQKKE